MNWPAAIYCVLVDCLIWGGTGYAVFALGHSGWWFALALVASSQVGVPEGVRRPVGKSEGNNK